VSEVWWAYLLVLVGTGLLSAGLTSTATRTASLWIMADLQNLRHGLAHDLGGSSIVAAFVVAVPVTSKIRPLAGGREEIFAVVAVTVLLLVVGLVGDSRRMLPSWHLGAEIAGAVVISSSGLGIALVSSDTVNLFLNILWFVAIANAFKLIDHPIGLATGVATVTCFSLFALASTNGQVLIATLSIGLAGSTAGFFSHTIHKDEVLSGESSTRTIGFLIAFLAIQVDGPVNRIEGLVNALMPILVCSLVLFNLSWVIVARLLARGSPTQARQGGVSHELLAMGLGSSAIRGWSFFIAGALGALSYVIYRIDQAAGTLLTGLIGLAFLIGGVLLVKASLNREHQEKNYSALSRHQP
jgi:UDP-GlcNAc:undecaprenyl-phosphate/decaprenyl-phosphate GlcNAc-1-phosphate transferase